MTSTEFWDQKHNGFKPVPIDPSQLPRMLPPRLKLCAELAGVVAHKDVLDLGCGNGYFAAYFAKLGAKVTAIDISEQAIRNVVELSRFNQVENLVDAHQLSATDLRGLDRQFDLVVGRFILHHVEPFEDFSQILFDVMKKGGRGVFIENSARSSILMLFRKYLAGRFGIEKASDDQEHPLTTREVQVLEKQFDRVEIHFPDFAFFRLLGTKVFRRGKKLQRSLKQLDDRIYQSFPKLRKYSYYQVVEIEKS